MARDRERDLAEDRAPDRVMAGAAQADQAQRLAGRDRERDRARHAPATASVDRQARCAPTAAPA